MRHNPVAKNAGVNRAQTHRDRKKDAKRGHLKHKRQPRPGVDYVLA